MRAWRKYLAAPATAPRSSDEQGSYESFAAQMGGYRRDASYDSREAFVERRFHQDGYGRLALCQGFLERHLPRPGRILSVASGRCANEVLLCERGYDVLCSDLGRPDCLEATQALFPGLRFTTLDVLRDEPPGRFDAVMSLSLIFCFDDDALDRFFERTARMLVPGGRLLLDFVGSPDNAWSRLLHDVFLPLEAHGLALWRGAVEGRPHRVERTLHGYRRTDAEIVERARAHGFALKDFETGGELIDFRRGELLPRWIDASPTVRRLLTRIGRRMPYVRLGRFDLEGPGGG